MDLSIFKPLLELYDQVQKEQLRVRASDPAQAGRRGEGDKAAVSKDEGRATEFALKAIDLRERVQKVIDDRRVAVPDRDVRDILRGATAPLPLASKRDPLWADRPAERAEVAQPDPTSAPRARVRRTAPPAEAPADAAPPLPARKAKSPRPKQSGGRPRSPKRRK